MTDYSPDAAYRAAVAELPPGACPLLTRVTAIRMRRTLGDPWELLEIPEGTPADGMLATMMLRAVSSQDVLDLMDMSSRSEAFRHLEPCPLCAHRATPGPRVYAVWHTDPERAAEWEQGWREPEPRDLFELPNAAAAEQWAHQIAAFYAARVERSVAGRVDMRALLVAADPDALPVHRPLVAAQGSELWLWTSRPRKSQMRHPDRLLRLHQDGTLTTCSGPEAASMRPVVEPSEPSPSTFHAEQAQDGRQLVWFDDGDEGLLVSVLDPASSRPAVRVTAEGEVELRGAVPGLRVFGRHVGDRPPLSDLTVLAPGFTDLAPEHVRCRSASRRSSRR